MDDLAKELLEGLDDVGFCQCLLSIMQSPGSLGLELIFEEWALARLRLIHQREPRIFYGMVLTPLQIAFPGKVYPQFIMEAMRSVATQPQAEGGDVIAEAFAGSIDELFTYGLPKAHTPGWQSLALYYTVRRGELTIVTGVASHMKSTFVHSLCINLARQHGWNISLFNPEHYPLGTLGAWLVQSYMGQPLHVLTAEDRQHAIEWVTDHFHCMAPPDEVQPTLPWLLAVARLQKERYGLDGLVLDPWNEIEHCYGLQRETQYISDCLSQVRRFARAHQIHVWIVAHPTKLQKAVSGRYEGQYPVPTPYDISGSAHWYNKADNCLSLWRDALNDSPEVEVHVQKVRNRAVGHPGKVTLHYDGMRFQDIGDMTQPHWQDRN